MYRRMQVLVTTVALALAVLAAACNPGVTTGEVQGRVFWPDTNKPVTDVRISLYTDAVDAEPPAASAATTAPAAPSPPATMTPLAMTTDAQGRYAFAGLPPGTYGMGITIPFAAKSAVPCASLDVEVSGNEQWMSLSGTTKDGGYALILVNIGDNKMQVAAGAVVRKDITLSCR